MKKEIKTQLTKERIMNCALEEFGARGYAAGSVNNICAKGIPKGLLYHNFSGKDDLYLACVAKCFDDFVEYMKNADADKDLKRYFDARMTFFKLHENRCKILFEVIIQPQSKLQTQVNALKKGFDTMNENLIKNLIAPLKLRTNVSESSVTDYFRFVQNMVNVYFGSQIFSSLTAAEIIEKHEQELPHIIDCMIYGIVER